MFWFKNLLSLDINLYIKTESKFVETILEARKHIDPSKTIIEEVSIKDLTSYKLFNTKLEQLMNSDEFKSIVIHPDVPEMSKPLYNVLMFEKVNFLKDVVRDNPFNTEYFSWVDAGFIRSEDDLKDIISWPDLDKLDIKDNKIKFFCINKDIVEHVPNIKDHLLSQMRLIKGTVFFLHKNAIDPLCALFNSKVEESLNKGYIGSDEKIFDICYMSYPELFDLYRCDWREELDIFAIKKPCSENTYDLFAEWDINEIDRTGIEDINFWFFSIEDDKGNVLLRDDINHQNGFELFQGLQSFKRVQITTDKKPKKFVIWPNSHSLGYLTPVKKNVRYIVDSIDTSTNTNKFTNIDPIVSRIDEFYYVNLARRTERLDFIKSEIKKSTILDTYIQRWDAQDGRDIHPSIFPRSILTKRGYDDIMSGLPVERGLSLTPGGLGFYLTHTKIFEHAVESNKTLFIMDDDVVVNEDFDKLLTNILHELPESFDFCYLGYYDTPFVKNDQTNNLFKPTGQICGPHGYIVTPTGAKKLLDNIFPMDIQLDTKLYMIQDHIDYYASNEKLLIYSDHLETDIQHETGCVRNY
jgi:GR25 family glycosyltransferase involved in LPS biosynthesis